MVSAQTALDYRNNAWRTSTKPDRSKVLNMTEKTFRIALVCPISYSLPHAGKNNSGWPTLVV